MDKEKMMAEISAGVGRLIDWHTSQINEDESKYERLYKDAINEIDDEIKSSKELIKDFDKNNLSINMAEQEGFLRALIFMKDLFEEKENYE